MKIPPPDPGLLSLNIATVREKWNLREAIEGCARHGIRGISPWRGKRLLAFHVCDWLVPTTDLLNDRGMIGDGVIDLPLIRSWMEAAGYREAEIFSARNWWKREPDDVLGIVTRGTRSAAEMN